MSFLGFGVCLILAMIFGFVAIGALAYSGANSVESKLGLDKPRPNIALVGWLSAIASNVFTGLGVWIAVSG